MWKEKKKRKEYSLDVTPSLLFYIVHERNKEKHQCLFHWSQGILEIKEEALRMALCLSVFQLAVAESIC